MRRYAQTQHSRTDRVSRTPLITIAFLLWGFAVFTLAGPDVKNIGGLRVAQHLGSVIGVSTEVPPNQFNSLALQLSQKEDALNKREVVLSQKEAILFGELEGQFQRKYAFLAIITIMLILLVGTNFYLDFKRRSALG